MLHFFHLPFGRFATSPFGVEPRCWRRSSSDSDLSQWSECVLWLVDEVVVEWSPDQCVTLADAVSNVTAIIECSVSSLSPNDFRPRRGKLTELTASIPCRSVRNYTWAPYVQLLNEFACERTSIGRHVVSLVLLCCAVFIRRLFIIFFSGVNIFIFNILADE